jgi:hypothetical protein
MKEIRQVEYRGWSFGQVLLAALTGAAAGATLAWWTGPAAGKRRRLGDRLRDTRTEVQAVPRALRRASEAAREAFLRTIEEQAGSDI